MRNAAASLAFARSVAFALAACLLVLSGAAHSAERAVPLVIEDGFASVPLGKYVDALEDPGGGLGIDDVRVAPYAERFRAVNADVPNFGYTESAWWLCFRLENRSPHARTLLLELRFPSIDHIALYGPVTVHGAPVQRAGDQLPFRFRPVPHRHFVFPVTVPARSHADYFLRLASESVLTAPMTLWSRTAFAESDRDGLLELGLFYGLVVALFLYNLMLFFTLRDRVYLVYVCYVAVFGLFLFCFDGLAFQYLWPESVWLANHALATALALTLLFGAAFARSFLSMPVNAPFADGFVRTVIGASAVLTVCAATGWLLSYGIVLRVLSLLGFATAAVVLGVAVRSLLRGYRPARFFLLAWSALLAFIALGALRNFALVPSNFLTVNGLHIGLVLDVMLLSFALGDRINALKRDSDRANVDLVESRTALLDAMRESDRALETGIAERTAELARINAQLKAEAGEREQLMRQLREREERMRFMAQHDPLTGLPNRMSMQQRLELALQLARRNRKKLAVMMIDLNGFKQLNDSRGHLVGDQALAAVAARLRTSVRASDTVARYGGDEFVAITGELDRNEDAAMIAEKMADTISVPLALDGGMARVGCAIGISLFPDDGEDAETLIARADLAMYTAKAGRGKRYAFFVAA